MGEGELRFPKRISVSKSDMEKMLHRLEEIYRRHGVTAREKDRIWQTMATFCFYQLETKCGLFYKAARRMLKINWPALTATCRFESASA
jgi:hypothetical protein